MTRIKLSKDNLLKESYVWILHDPAFIDWRDNDTQLLWIKGDPGKGKTMLMIGLIEELLGQLKARPGSGILSYFFCQGTDSRLNNAVSILKGLIYQLAEQHTSLIRHLQKKYDSKERQFSEDTNRLCVLWTILLDMLHDSSLATVYLMVDALDECDSELSQLLDLIAHNTSKPSSRVKWLVSSRSRPIIEVRLRPDKLRSKISLESNSCHTLHAVNAFIDFKVSELAEGNEYDTELYKEVNSYLRKNAGGTFLWVALVCKELRDVEVWDTLEILKKFPPGLRPLYERMIEQIWSLKSKKSVEFCTQVLSTATLAYRPIHLRELVDTAGLPEKEFNDLRRLSKLVDLCGSFLTVREDTLYFIHQTAKDFLAKDLQIFPLGQAEEHCKIAFRSLQVMSNTLRRDICGLRMPGALLNEPSSINQDPLAHIRYACCYWIPHLRDAGHLQHDQVGLCNGGKVYAFLQEHLLHWLEALSLMGIMSDGAVMVKILEEMLTVSDSTKLQY
jgi:hypothetical protein